METLQLPQDLYWGTKSEPPSPVSDDQLFPSISLFSPKLESDDETEDVLSVSDAETEELIAAFLMDGEEIFYQLEISQDKKGQWDCIQGANYSSHLLPLPITHIKDSTSELKRYSDNTDIIQLTPQTFTPDSFNFAINSYAYAQHIPQPPTQLQQHQELQHNQQLEHESEQQKIDYENLFSDLNSVAFKKLSKDEFLGSPTPSSSSAYEESSESERGDEIVDEILRIHSKDLPDLTDDNDSQYSSTSFYSESNDSYKIKSVDSMSPASNHDWPLLTTSDEYSSQENLQRINNKNYDFNGGQTIKKRSRLYVRNIDEKKNHVKKNKIKMQLHVIVKRKKS